VLVSPAFKLCTPGYDILKHVFHMLPMAVTGRLLRLMVGKSNYTIKLINELQARYWTVEYPVEALLNIFELYYFVEYNADLATIECPVFAIASQRDTVVSFAATTAALQKMTGAVTALKDMTHAKGYHAIVGEIFNEEKTDNEAIKEALGFLGAELP